MSSTELRDGLVELYRRMACDLPGDVERSLCEAVDVERSGSSARSVLESILRNVEIARRQSRPMCQDTGMPVLYVGLPLGYERRRFQECLQSATREAVKTIPLRANAVDCLTGRNSGDGVGVGIPLVHYAESDDEWVRVEGMLKGGGCENQTMVYKLPDEGLGAGRDLEGVRRCVLDAVVRAQGKACPPYVLGVGLGGAVESVAGLAKRQLMRKLGDVNGEARLGELETRLVRETNGLGIGPGGLGGVTTALGVKIGAYHRHPASYFVVVSFACWACRRGGLKWRAGELHHEA